MLHYAKEVADVLADLEGRETFKRLFLVGSDEAMLEIESVLSETLKEKLVAKQSVDLYQEDEVWAAVQNLFAEAEREKEKSLGND